MVPAEVIDVKKGEMKMLINTEEQIVTNAEQGKDWLKERAGGKVRAIGCEKLGEAVRTVSEWTLSESGWLWEETQQRCEK